MTPAEMKTVKAIADKLAIAANKIAAEMSEQLMHINGALESLKAQNKALREENARLWEHLRSYQVSLGKRS